MVFAVEPSHDNRQNKGAKIMKRSRPIIISIAVVLGMIGAVIGVIGSIAVLAVFPLVGVIALIISLIQIAILMGLWNMKRWALIVYTVLFVINLFTKDVTFWIIIPILVIIFGFLHFKDMD